MTKQNKQLKHEKDMLEKDKGDLVFLQLLTFILGSSTQNITGSSFY